MPGLEVAEQPENPTGPRFVTTDSGSAGGGRVSRPGRPSGRNFAHKSLDENPGHFPTTSLTHTPGFPGRSSDDRIGAFSDPYFPVI